MLVRSKRSECAEPRHAGCVGGEAGVNERAAGNHGGAYVASDPRSGGLSGCDSDRERAGSACVRSGRSA
jgi:hypothetical protein